MRLMIYVAMPLLLWGCSSENKEVVAVPHFENSTSPKQEVAQSSVPPPTPAPSVAKTPQPTPYVSMMGSIELKSRYIGQPLAKLEQDSAQKAIADTTSGTVESASKDGQWTMPAD